jgi:hypothetical protein
MSSEDDSNDWRLDELRRLGETERRMSRELIEARDSVARLVKELLPQHASRGRIEAVVEASGYSRTPVEALRGGRGMWNKSN